MSRAVNSFVFVSGCCILSSPSVIFLGGYVGHNNKIKLVSGRCGIHEFFRNK